MTSDAYLRRVSDRTVQELLADPSRVNAVLFPSSTETVIDDEVLIVISAWDLLDHALGADRFLASGGTPIGDIVVGGEDPARAFTSAEVRRIAAKLALTTEANLGQFYGQAMSLPAGSPTANDAIADYAKLKEFVTDTARAEAAMIVFIG